jgi:dTDP-4-amino-4,6-dideoxygalactose transaminase
LDLKKGDEVICPSLTFIAPANMILLSGAKLILADIDRDTLTIDPKEILKKITKKTKAILVVHQFGHAAHMDEIKKISRKV